MDNFDIGFYNFFGNLSKLDFSSFYLNKHSGRKISLHSNLGHAEVLATFNGSATGEEATMTATPSQLEFLGAPSAPHRFTSSTTSATSSASASGGAMISGLPGSPGVSDPSASATLASTRKYILQVSTFQMVILMLFNHRNRYTFSELLAESGIPERDLTRNLMALCMSRSTPRILCRVGGEARATPSTTAANVSIANSPKEFEPTDVFYVNNSFVSRHYKIKVSSFYSESGISCRWFLFVLRDL